jgi:nitroreductase
VSAIAETVAAAPVLEAMRRRRMHRAFTEAAVTDDQLEQLAWASSRAPMGGNQLMRRIVVVTDPPRVRSLRSVTPSFGATGNVAVMILCTDTEVALERMGTLGADLLSLVDAGAAAENVALAAPALGLGVSFIRSANDAALRRVLDLPAHVRPDMMIAIGHPVPRPPAAARVRRPEIYRDAFGQPWRSEQ